MAQDDRVATRNAGEVSRLERVVIDAFYLGCEMQALGERGDFLLGPATRLAASALLTWARLASRQLEDGAPVFLHESPPQSEDTRNAFVG